jgi:3'-5' exoribonuclease
MTAVPPPIRSLGDKTYLEGVYSIVNPQLGQTRNGKPFLKCLLRDASGELPCRMWSCDEATFAKIAHAGFVRVRGNTETYNGGLQIILQTVDPAEPNPEELGRLLPTTRHDIDSMYAAVTSLLHSMRHPGMRALADAYLGDEKLMRLFCRAPAATSLHHAYIGGLLEHTLQLMRLADAMLPLYPELNRDLVLLGLFLHDLGKTTELEWERGFSYTIDGNLVGHVVRGAIWLQGKALAMRQKGGAELPPEAVRVLMHIIVSHHGSLEFGAAKLPATPEAIFVAMLDNLDAKTAMALGNARREDYDRPGAEPTADFTEKLWALDTRIYRPDPLRERPESPDAG